MKEAPVSIAAVGGADIFFGPHIDDAESHLGGTQWWQRWWPKPRRVVADTDRPTVCQNRHAGRTAPRNFHFSGPNR